MRNCAVDELEKSLQKPAEAQFVDVREPAEFASEHIEGTLSMPLSKLGAETIATLDKAKPVYLICLGGIRACKAAEQLGRLGYSDLRILEGGLKSWLAAGKSVIRGTSRVWSLDRQVRFAAGTLIVSGLILGQLVHPAWRLLSLFVAAGLMYSAVTDTCSMSCTIALMPWNKTSC
ncbi:MAG: rhodanese-like domain-containing protein [Candidatus Omnitrophota bacterium]|jgi:rhodanese-related sulfurtransferase